jgi:hypothetical protein
MTTRHAIIMIAIACLAVANLHAEIVVASGAPGDPKRIDKLFRDASQAYDRGNYDEAIRQYNAIQREGFTSPELYYNLGNAYFKRGRYGMAVLNYRSAWYLKPRDADIHANLQYALQNAGSNAPVIGRLASVLLRVSFIEWLTILLAAYWLCAGAAAAYLLRQRSALMLRLTGLTAGIALLALLGVTQWWILQRRPELVIIEPSRQALFAPMHGATPHFTLPEGSIVRLLEKSGAWVKVKSGRDSGWIPSSACRSAWPGSVTEQANL